jgi:hypothetical protein
LRHRGSLILTNKSRAQPQPLRTWFGETAGFHQLERRKLNKKCAVREFRVGPCIVTVGPSPEKPAQLSHPGARGKNKKVHSSTTYYIPSFERITMSVSVPYLRPASNCLPNLNLKLKILSQEIKLLARLPIVARCKHRRLSENASALDAQSQRRIRNLAPSPEDAARRHGGRRVRAGVAAEQPILTPAVK